MDFLKDIFGAEALTFEQFQAKVKENGQIKLADLSGGQYVAKQKLTDSEALLAAANGTIRNLQDTLKKFDGVDVAKLQGDLAALQKKYDDDTAHLKKASAIGSEAIKRGARNPELVMRAINMDAVKIDGDQITGLAEQFDNLQKSDPYLFNTETTDVVGTGHAGGGGRNDQEPDYANMSDAEYYAAMAAKK